MLRSRRASFPSWLIPVLLPTYYVFNIIYYWYEVLQKTSCWRNVVLTKRRSYKTPFLQNAELLNRRASKNVVLPKRPSHQSKTSFNFGRATYSTHSSLTITSSPTSYFKTSRSILIARNSTTTMILDHSHSFFLTGFYILPPPLNRIRPRILSCAIAHLRDILHLSP